MTAEWITSYRREPLRAAIQHDAANRRRVAAVERGRHAVGSYDAVAEHLGGDVTRQALSKARKKTEERPAPEPIADYVEIDLPRTGADTVTTAEWQELEGPERSAAARRTAASWWALATSSGQLARTTRAAGEGLAQASLEWEAGAPLAQNRALVDEVAGPGWSASVTSADAAHTLSRVLVETASSYRRQADTAWHQHGIWDQRATEQQD